MLRVLLGIAIGTFIYANPEARQITADLLRATGDALAPAVEDRTLGDRINEVLVGDQMTDQWKTEYARSNDLNKNQLRILQEGPRSLSESWILGAMHYNYKRSKQTQTDP